MLAVRHKPSSTMYGCAHRCCSRLLQPNHACLGVTGRWQVAGTWPCAWQQAPSRRCAQQPSDAARRARRSLQECDRRTGSWQSRSATRQWCQPKTWPKGMPYEMSISSMTTQHSGTVQLLGALHSMLMHGEPYCTHTPWQVVPPHVADISSVPSLPACSPMVDNIASFSPDLPAAAAASIADAPLDAADAAQHADSCSESSSGIEDSDDDSSASNGGIRGGFNSHSPGAAGAQGDSFDDDDDGYVDTLRRRLAADGSGFESAFDDEFEPMRYCVNCTGALHGDVCLVRPACWFCRRGTMPAGLVHEQR